jgi:membrane-associated protease RseP (regulator of RpoE activity)
MTPEQSSWQSWSTAPLEEAPEVAPRFEPPPATSRRRLALHFLLLLGTVITTCISGAILQGVDLLNHPGLLWTNPFLLYQGLPFSLTLLLILGSHEMGHYLVARYYRMDVTLPFFIPGPPLPPGPGTFGAVIRIRSPIRDRRALLDVGCAGPLIGVAVSIPVILVGLKLSSVATVVHGQEGLVFGEPLLFRALSWLVFGKLAPHQDVLIHPVAYAGWLGLFITALNLMPVGQLDGGHVIYALFPKLHRYISWICLGLLAVFAAFFWLGWLIWVILIFFVLGWRHPPPYYDWVPLDRRRKLLGVLTILVFILTFSPAPFSLG